MKTTNVNSLETFAAACRFNSGKSLLDSGDAYGRHWQKPAIALDCSPVIVRAEQRKHGAEVCATIETAHFLAEALKVDFELQSQFEDWAAEQEGTWFELGERFATEVLGMTQHARDNVYNGENDLSQVFIWEAYSPNDHESDWIYAKDPLCVIYVHTGCDVRGGYSKPLFCRSKGDYAVPVDYCAQFYAESGTDADGVELTEAELQDISDKWCCGYSSHPSYQVEKEIETVLECDESGQWFTAKLASGETVKIVPSLPYV